MAKSGKFIRKVGKSLASLVVGASTLISASNIKGATTNDIISVADIIPYTAYVNKTACYNSNNVKFNNRVSKEKIILLFVYDSDPRLAYNSLNIRGGLNITENSSEITGTNGYLALVTSGKVPTNGLNGASYWVGGHDLNGNGKVGTYVVNDDTTWSLNWEAGERIDPSQISFTGMPAFPADKTSTVSIASIKITGYQDANGNGVPDYFEAKYPTIIGKLAGNDEDADGQTDYQEWVAGTDPTSATSYFGVKSLDNGTNTFALNIGNTLEGRLYDVAASTNLTDSSSWTNKIYDFAGNETNTLYVEKDPANKQEFYKPSVKLSPYEKVNP